MPLVKLVWYYLWIAPHLFLAAILVVMAYRRQVRAYPWFFTYVLLEVGQFIVLFSIRYLPSLTAEQYFRVYSAFVALSTVLRFGIIVDAMGQLSRRYAALERSSRQLFRWMAAVLLLAGLGLAAYAGGDTTDRSWFLVNILNRTALILQTGLLVGLFAVTRYLGLSWRNQTFGIVLGLGLYACADLVGTAIRSQTGFAHTQAVDYLNMVAFHCSALVWLLYLLAPERSLLPGATAVSEHRDAEAWNRELERLLHQ